ncbi:MAG TPA: BON domain-containing protein [Burkholderiales bacterium]|nr:BON domain-containing protein [Burkholderiales bacterium]
MKTNKWLTSWTLMLSVLSLFAVLAGCASTPSSDSTGQYIDDATITTKVKAAFVKDDEVSALHIHVTTFKGVVQLSGFADNQNEINRAVELARNVKGVESVKNDIHLK